jgi:hypothetical protein
MNWSDAHERFEFAQRTAAAARRVVFNEEVIDVWADEAVRTESPLEAAFVVNFCAASAYLLMIGHHRYALRARPQVWVETPSGGRYRLDFALEPLDEWLRDALVANGLELKIGAELDGHDFHERTREQVIERNQRDRELAAMGWRVLHFSGSELHQNPMAVAIEVLEAGAVAFDAAKAALRLS